MQLSGTTPTSQRNRPISFVFEYASGSPLKTVTLPVRPEDLNINRPHRTTVHQTLGRGVQGWSDNFGAGLPTVTISGHTGWRETSSGMDGMQAFMELDRFINTFFPGLKQVAIDGGVNPAMAKLILVDALDEIAWEVTPMVFSLRRNKSRPLLVQYNMNFQVINTQVDGGFEKYRPVSGSLSGGLGALGGVLGKIAGLLDKIKGAVTFLKNIAGKVMAFVNLAVGVLKMVQAVVSSVKGFITGVAGLVIGIAKGISLVGREIFRTFAAIASIPGTIKAAFAQVASAFHEAVCIFSNSLKPKKTYEAYTGVYGASNCSSTTGGSAPSPFADQNLFAVMNDNASAPVKQTTPAISSVDSILRSDGAQQPLQEEEIGRHLDNINAGTVIAA
jgi:hypothetical protein